MIKELRNTSDLKEENQDLEGVDCILYVLLAHINRRGLESLQLHSRLLELSFEVVYHFPLILLFVYRRSRRIILQLLKLPLVLLKVVAVIIKILDLAL